jgi:hypothetical protein
MLGQRTRVDDISIQHQWLSPRLCRIVTPPTLFGNKNRVAMRRRCTAASRDVHFAYQTRNSSQERDCFPALMSVSPTPVIAVSLASWTAAACTMHAANLPTLDCGCAAWLSGSLRGGAAPRRLLHEIDYIEEVVRHWSCYRARCMGSLLILLFLAFGP